MRILISNDDGIDAPGIRALAETLQEQNEVYICAPDRERSGSSHRITYFFKDMKVESREISGTAHAWAVGGTPADCVYAGVTTLLEQAPDLVLTGINQGANMSIDCLYSGTVGAATEGLILGVPAMAVSLDSFTQKDFTVAAAAARDLIPLYLSDPDCLSYIMNINVPALPADKIRGFRITDFDPRKQYARPLDRINVQGSSFELHCPDWEVPVSPEIDHPEGDITAVEDGYISITPLQLDLVQHQKQAFLQALEQLPVSEK